MTEAASAKKSPNPQIDRVLRKLLRTKSDPETLSKIIAQAIAWEKTKHQINDKEEGFNPDNL